MTIRTRTTCCPKGQSIMTSEYDPPPEDSKEYMEAAGFTPLEPVVEMTGQALSEALVAQAVAMHKKPTPTNDRVTQHFTLTHEQVDENPTAFEHHSYRILEGSGESYARKLKVKPGKQEQLDFGWIDEPGLLVLENNTKWKGSLNPTPEEREALEDTILYVSMCEECPIEKALIVRPGGFMYVEVGEQSALFLQTVGGGVASINAFILPR